MSQETVVVIHKTEKMTELYSYSEVEVKMPTHDTDIVMIMPNGKKIAIQYRMEQPSIDICMEDNLVVTNWIGEDMEKAPIFDGMSHVHTCGQLVIDIPPSYVGEEEDEETEE